MRLLLIHADYLEFEVKQPTPAAEETELRKGRFEEALVVFTAIEERDEGVEGLAKKAAEEIEDVSSRVGVRRIVIYPYAHLSSSLAAPRVALKILEELKEELAKRGYEVTRVPFGWYKAFRLSCKGHPLSELSKEISAETPSRETEVSKEPKRYLLIEPNGNERLVKLEELEDLSDFPDLKQFLLSEELGVRSGKEPPHIRLMRRLEIADYEPASDVGHFRFYPKGWLIKELLQDLAWETASELGALRVETPVMYRESEPDIAEQASKFRQRDYRIRLLNYSLLLRFAGDFGLFRMMKQVTMSYKHLPLRVFELSHSYRLEQSGECVGLKRLRAFTMPDLHCFCADMEQALQEYELLFNKYFELTRKMGIDFVIVFRVTSEFYSQHRDFIVKLLKQVGKPALVEILPHQKHYWVMKHEFQFIDSTGDNAQLATVQLDVEDSMRYGIMYVDHEGKKRGCIILHSSMGSIERWIYAILEHAAKKMESGEVPSLPLWLSPTQVRFLPVSGHHVDMCMKHAKFLQENGIRADVDDRDLTLSKKVREAETEWVPFIVVVGDEEVRTGVLSVRIRGEGDRKMSPEQLVNEIKSRTGKVPFRPLDLPLLLSKRPIFVGA